MMPLQKSFLFPFSAAVLACALAACGGGGGGSSPAPSIGGGSGGNGSGSGSTSKTATASIAVSLQQYAPVQATSTKRRAAFLSPATAQISLTLVSVDGVVQTGSTQTYPVGPNATNCSSVNGIVNCALSMTLPIGTDVLAASTLDSSNHPLGTSQISATIVANASNRVTLAIGGTIASIEVFLSNNSFTPGAAAKANVIVVPLDSSGAQIVNPGNYNPPIAISEVNDSGATGHFSLITNGTNTGLSSTVNSPNDQVILNYDGAGTSGQTSITASATGANSGTASAAFSIAGLSTIPTGAQLSGPSFIFSSAGQSDTIDVVGGTPPYTIASSDTSLATVSGNSPHFTVTSVGYGTNGAATITVTDHVNATTTTPVTFIAAPIVLGVTTCGSGNTCGSIAGGITSTYSAPANGTSVHVNPTVFTAGGGTGTYNYAFVSTGTQTSAYATVAQAGSQFTITPNGSGSDGIIVLSGNQTAYFGTIAASSSPGYTIGSTFQAYPTSASALTLAKSATAAGQATITLSTAGAPWTINNTCSSVASVANSNNSVVVQALATSGTCTVNFAPATGSPPLNLTITDVPDITVSATTATMHALLETTSFTIQNAGLVTISDITESSGGAVISINSFVGGAVLQVIAHGPGVSRIIVHDELLDQNISMAVNVDSAFFDALPQTAIGAVAGGSAVSRTVNYALASGSIAANSGAAPALNVTAGNPGTITVTPAATAGTGTFEFVDVAGGVSNVNYTDFLFVPSLHPGSAIGAAATVAFSAVGQQDTVFVTGPSGSIGALSSNSGVASISSIAGNQIGITANAAGTATITVNDLSNNNASATFAVSVTTTTIPIAGHQRHP